MQDAILRHIREINSKRKKLKDKMIVYMKNKIDILKTKNLSNLVQVGLADTFLIVK